MTGAADELGRAPGPPGPKMVRFMYFVGAGILCTAVINKWRDLERKSVMQQQQQKLSDPSHSPDASLLKNVD